MARSWRSFPYKPLTRVFNVYLVTVIVSGVGSSIGTSTVACIGASTTTSIATSDGAGIASGIGISTAASIASSDGIGIASSIGNSTAASSTLSSGIGAALGIGISTAASIGASDGVGAATAIGSVVSALPLGGLYELIITKEGDTIKTNDTVYITGGLKEDVTIPNPSITTYLASDADSN